MSLEDGTFSNSDRTGRCDARLREDILVGKHIHSQTINSLTLCPWGTLTCNVSRRRSNSITSIPFRSSVPRKSTLLEESIRIERGVIYVNASWRNERWEKKWGDFNDEAIFPPVMGATGFSTFIWKWRHFVTDFLPWKFLRFKRVWFLSFLISLYLSFSLLI